MKSELEPIRSARQLQILLSFQQDSLSDLKHALRSFKAFLDSIDKEDGISESQKSTRERILLDYLDSQKARDGDDQSVFLAQLMQAWSLASQNNYDALLSTIPANLALLLRTTSSKIKFREHGVLLGQTLLQPAQLKLLARGASSNKTKEHLIAPCLRLLSEVVSFDGGSLAKRVYAAREFTFKGLARNLGLSRASSGNLEEDRRKPSIRTNSLRYVLANLRFQSAANKSDVLTQRDVISAIFRDLGHDSPDIVSSLLHHLKQYVVLDDALHKGPKARLLTEWTLGRIATLYDYEQDAQHGLPVQPPIHVQAHEFLLLVCTTPDKGVLRARSGWYPPGSDRDTNDEYNDFEHPDAIDLGLESVQLSGRLQERLSIRNTTLARFSPFLRPYASALQSQLLIEIFKAAPELVADYFFRKTTFNLDPKLTTTWIGYSAFVFSTVQIPVPKFFGQPEGYAKRPPPISIVLENIIPQPLNQKILTRCLNHSSSLIAFFAVRLLVMAFQKLQEVLQGFRHASLHYPLVWEQGSSRLITAFCRRCPRMKDVITVFRRVSSRDGTQMQREAITRLLIMYYRCIPQVALDEKFDVSAALADVLTGLEQKKEAGEDSEMRLLELDHLLSIARHSPDMRWWHKLESCGLSPFTLLLKLLVESPTGLPTTSIRSLVHSVSRDAQLFQNRSTPPALDVLIASLADTRPSINCNAIYGFVDDSMARYVRKPVQYQGEVEVLASASNIETLGLSPLLMTLVEQWPFILKSTTIKGDQKTNILRWFARLLGYLAQAGENDRLLSALVESMRTEAWSKPHCEMLQAALQQRKQGGFADVEQSFGSTGSEDPEHSLKSKSADTADEDEKLEQVILPSEDPAALFRWTKKDVRDVVEEGDGGALILCLCSSEVGVRRQSMSGLSKLIARLQQSSYAEKEMVVLLLQELIHTAKGVIDEAPLPTYLALFAARAMLVQANPQHCLYGKVNHFLHQGPIWDKDRVPLMSQILLHPPDEDDSRFQELDWFLSMIHDGVRTSEDMNVYRHRNVFESVLSMYPAPHLPSSLRDKILGLILRASGVPGGSTTLITRTGVLSWLQAQLGRDGSSSDMRLVRMANRLWDTCDQKHVEAWSGGLVTDYVAGL